VVHGEKRKYLTLVVTLDPDVLKQTAKELGLGNGSIEELTQRPEIEKVCIHWIDEVNTKARLVREHQEVFSILDHDFTIEAGEMTPFAQDPSRKVVNDRYKEGLRRDV